jgi:hypothetical protein
MFILIQLGDVSIAKSAEGIKIFDLADFGTLAYYYGLNFSFLSIYLIKLERDNPRF